MSDKFYVGLDLTGFEDNGIQRPISRVTLKLDDENVLTAGDDSGFELIADCPHATQAIVNSILAEVRGFRYQMYDASDINIDPSMELGDGITASGVYSVISRVADDGSGFPSASAPGEAELEDEYPTGGPMTQEFNRKIAETRSRITKTAEEIRLEVEKVNGDLVEMSSSISIQLGKISQKVEDNINGLRSEFTIELGKISQKVEDSASGLSSEFTVALNSITSRVQSAEGNISTLQQTASSLQSQITNTNGAISKIEQKVDNITLSVTNGSTSSTIKLLANGVEISSQNISMSGLVTFQGLSDGTTTINGGCIKTGTIESMRINSSSITGGTITGASITGGSLRSESATGGSIAYVTINKGILSFEFAGEEQGFFRANSANGGVWLYTNSGFRVLVGGQMQFSVGDRESGFYTNIDEIVYCYNDLDLGTYNVVHISDQRMKTNILESDISALKIINAIQTYSFDWKKDGKHENLGFIAQQLEKVSPDFVNISKMDGHYSTKDMKLIPYLVKAIQELSEEIGILKGAAI